MSHLAPLSPTQNSQKDIFITSKAVDIIHSPYYILGDENIFAVLYMCHFAINQSINLFESGEPIEQ